MALFFFVYSPPVRRGALRVPDARREKQETETGLQISRIRNLQ